LLMPYLAIKVYLLAAKKFYKVGEFYSPFKMTGTRLRSHQGCTQRVQVLTQY